MKPREIIVTGIVKVDGTAQITRMPDVIRLLSEYPSARFTARFTVTDVGGKPLSKYYFTYVVPTVQKALQERGDWRTEKDADEYLRRRSPIMWRERVDYETGEWTQELRSISDLDGSEWYWFMEQVRYHCGQDLHVYIDDPANWIKDE